MVGIHRLIHKRLVAGALADLHTRKGLPVHGGERFGRGEDPGGMVDRQRVQTPGPLRWRIPGSSGQRLHLGRVRDTL